MALSKDAIVDAALRILDQYGLGDLSMRRVADDLGVQAGALYYHVPNKQSLLAAVSDRIVREIPPASGQSLREQLEGWAGGLRSALLAHRDAAELVSSAHALGLGESDPAAGAREALGGRDNAEATAAALLHFLLGHVMTEQTRSQLHALGVVETFDRDSSTRYFEWGIDLMIRGITGAQR